MKKKLIFIMLFGLSIIVLGTFSIGCGVDKNSKGSCAEGDLQLRFLENKLYFVLKR